MDAKITKQRISRMLSYDWLKIVGLALACMFFWGLIFTMTATRILPYQQFTIFSHYINAPLSDGYYSRVKAMKGTVFSYETIETHSYDLGLQKDMSGQILQTRISTNEGDVIFLPKSADKDSPYKDGDNTTYPLTYMDTMFVSYYTSFFDIEKYLQSMDAYLDGFYYGDHSANAMDEELVKTSFIKRVTANKDKRFKKEKQKQAGALLEVERIAKYKTAYDEFNWYLENGVVCLETVKTLNRDGSDMVNTETGAVFAEGKYALNLCPNVETMGKLSEWHQYNIGTEDNPIWTAKDMCVMFFDMYGVEDSYEYESLLYVTHLIKTCSTLQPSNP